VIHAERRARVFPVDVDLAVLQRRAHRRASHPRLAVRREALGLQQRNGHRRHDLLLGERLAADDDRLCSGAAAAQDCQREAAQQPAH